MPFFRSLAPSRVNTRNFPSGNVITSFTRRVFEMIESVTRGLAGLLISSAYSTSPPPPEPRYACLPSGCNHTSSVVKRERGKRPTSESGRRTSRGARVMVLSTLRAPNDAVIV